MEQGFQVCLANWWGGHCWKLLCKEVSGFLGRNASQERRNETTDTLDPGAKPDSSGVRGKVGCGGVAQLVLYSEPHGIHALDPRRTARLIANTVEASGAQETLRRPASFF